MADDGLPAGYKFYPTTPPKAAPPSSTGLPSGYKPTQPPAPTAAPAAPAAPVPPPASTANATPPVDPSAPAPGGYDLGPLHFGYTNRGVPGVSWSGSSWFPSSQTVHNVQNRLTNDAVFNAADPITAAVGGGDLATLRAQRQQMDASMSPAAKATADIGAQFMPQNILLNRFAGPIAQGAVDRGLSSLNQGNDWSQVGADTRTGAETGAVAKILGGLNPSSAAPLVRWGLEKTPSAIGWKLGDFGGGWMADKLTENFVKPAAEKAGDWVSRIPSLPSWARQPIQQAIIGGQPAASQTQVGQNLGGLASNLNWNDAKTALTNLRGMMPF